MKKKKLFDRGILKTHAYQSFRFAPTTEHTNEGIDTVVKACHSVLNQQLFKSFRDGQPTIAFELYGNTERSFYLVTAPTSHASLIEERLTSAFEGAGVKRYTHTGWPFIDTENTLLAYLTLDKSSFFPINMENDKLIAKDLMHILEDIREGEEVFLQILLEPVHNGWQTELEQSYEKYLTGDQGVATGNVLRNSGRKLDEGITRMASIFNKSTVDATSVKKHREIKEVRQKFAQSGFHVSVRIATKSSKYNRRNDLLEGIASSFKIVNGHNQWASSPVLRRKSVLQAMQERKISLLSTPVLLCDDEVKTLISFPTKEVKTTRLERMTPDEKKIDPRITKDIIQIGRSIKFDETGLPVGFNVADLDTASKARLFIAPPGSGKTTLAKTFMQGAMEKGHGGSIFDVADGSLYYDAISATPPEMHDKLVLVDFANESYPHIFNFSSLGRDADTVGEMFTEFFEVFFKTQANHRMNSFLRKGSMTNFTNPDATFLELILLLRDDDYRNRFLPGIRASHPDLYLWWKTEFPKIASSESQITQILQPILYRLDELQYNKRLGPIFCGRGGRMDIFNWMNEGKWVLYNLSNGAFLENEQRMLMSFLNYAYWSATLARERMLQNNIQPIVHHKIYDEPQTYMTSTPVTKLSISKSRKYRVSDNFFIQSPSQVIERDKELWTQILDMNPHILIGGGLSNDNLKMVSKEFMIPLEELKQLEQLEYHWFLKTYVGKESIPPFIFDARIPLKKYNRDTRLEEKWRHYFAPKSYAQVKEEINARNFKLTIQEYRDLIESYGKEDALSMQEEGVYLGEDT